MQVLVKTIQLSAIVLFVGIGIYCFANFAELYPLAPYSMYGNKHEIKGINFLRFLCINDKGSTPLTNEMTRPLDEARLTQSIEESFLASRDEEIREKLKSLKDQTFKNNFECSEIVLNIANFDSSDQFLKDEYTVVKSFRSGDRQ